MGRELRRVPLDFGWPLKKTWKGYLNPYGILRVDCPDCGGSGYAPQAKRFEDEWYGHVAFDPVAYGAKPLTIDNPKIRDRAVRNVSHSPDFYMTPDEMRRERENLQRAGVDLMELQGGETAQQEGLVPIEGHRRSAIAREQRRLFEQCFRHQWMHHLIQADVDALVAHGRLMDFTNRPINQEQADKLKMQEAAGGSGYWLKESNGHHPTADEVNDWSLDGMAHDSINAHVCIEARCEREGFPHTCTKCGGDGDYYSAEDKKLHDEWEPEGPPDGPGFQLWETTSEGSPVSPVFPTLDALCEWAAEGATTFGSFKASAAEWRKMLDADFVCHAEGNAVFI